jgi:uncharacterized protein YdbL (DUF1318 family)
MDQEALSPGRRGGSPLRNPRLGRGIVAAFALVSGALSACVPVTVNVNFPQERLDDAASQIVDMSRRPEGSAPAPGSAPPARPKPGSSLDPWLAPLAPGEAWAQEHKIEVTEAPKTDSPELRRLTESQKRRLGAVQQWLARGCIGESNQGLLEARPGQGCSGEVAKLIGDENRDRQAIIETFMRQNRIPDADAARVRASFAKAYRDRAGSGQWVQTDPGAWVKK